jgi:hypothetical protein
LLVEEKEEGKCFNMFFMGILVEVSVMASEIESGIAFVASPRRSGDGLGYWVLPHGPTGLVFYTCMLLPSLMLDILVGKGR